MNIRENFEKREESFISPYGCLSSKSKGRLKPEPLCPVRTCFQRDRDRIVYSNAFRALKHKTQVFLSPLGAQYRTRLTHTLEVAQVSRTIARAMRLNEDLAEAIALGHDLGHTPFGHSGETALKSIYPHRFSHKEQSLRVVDVLERDGEGLNLTHEVRDGILKHSKGFGKIIPDDPNELAFTVEGRIVRISDIIGYLNHDLDDAVRSGVISNDDVPKSCKDILGGNHPERATTMIQDLIYSSKVVDGRLQLKISDAVFGAMLTLRKFLYHNVYRSPQVHNEFVKAKKILTELYNYFLTNERLLKEELAAMALSSKMYDIQPVERTVCDIIASMTDRYALNLYEKIFFPSPFT